MMTGELTFAAASRTPLMDSTLTTGFDVDDVDRRKGELARFRRCEHLLDVVSEEDAGFDQIENTLCHKKILGDRKFLMRIIALFAMITVKYVRIYYAKVAGNGI